MLKLHKITKVFLIAISAFLLMGCPTPFRPEFPVYDVSGYTPVYVSNADLEIKFLSPQPITSSGKIYIYSNYLFINDIYKGIHVLDNTDPSNPVDIGFLKIYGNVDIAIKGNALYADQGSDLITIDISDPKNPIVTSRQAGIFDLPEPVPPENGVYFECIDASKGIFGGWKRDVLAEPKCYH